MRRSHRHPQPAPPLSPARLPAHPPALAPACLPACACPAPDCGSLPGGRVQFLSEERVLASRLLTPLDIRVAFVLSVVTKYSVYG